MFVYKEASQQKNLQELTKEKNISSISSCISSMINNLLVISESNASSKMLFIFSCQKISVIWICVYILDGIFALVFYWWKSCSLPQLLEEGLQHQTWRMKESADFIELAMSLVCLDVHQKLDIVQTNCHEVAEVKISWSHGTLHVFRWVFTRGQRSV